MATKKTEKTAEKTEAEIKRERTAKHKEANVAKTLARTPGASTGTYAKSYNLKEGDTFQANAMSKALISLDRIDLHDYDAVKHRLEEYFDLMAEYDCRPSVPSMASALKMTRQTLSAIVHDRNTGGSWYSRSALPKEVQDLIKESYSMLEVQWDYYMQSGKINPVTGIFLGKNYYGMVDKQDYVITPSSTNEEVNVTDIRNRYMIDGEDDKKTH